MTRTNPIADAVKQLEREQAERHSWLSKAAEQIRQWREEDKRAGNPWEADQ